MAKLVDAPDLGSGVVIRVGSSPIRRTERGCFERNFLFFFFLLPRMEMDYHELASRFALAPPGCVHSASRVLFLRMATRVYDACSVNFVESVGDNKRSSMVSSRA